jgi:hypothetical protein
MPDWPGWNGCRALVTTSAPAVRRRDALGAQTGAQALGLALGPTAGGILVSTVGWRWVFFINVPVGLVALVAGYYLLPRTRQRSPMATVDLVSVGLLAVASTGLLLGMSAASGLSIPGLGILGSLLLAPGSWPPWPAGPSGTASVAWWAGQKLDAGDSPVIIAGRTTCLPTELPASSSQAPRGPIP